MSTSNERTKEWSSGTSTTEVDDAQADEEYYAHAIEGTVMALDEDGLIALEGTSLYLSLFLCRSTYLSIYLSVSINLSIHFHYNMYSLPLYDNLH